METARSQTGADVEHVVMGMLAAAEHRGMQRQLLVDLVDPTTSCQLPADCAESVTLPSKATKARSAEPIVGGLAQDCSKEMR